MTNNLSPENISNNLKNYTTKDSSGYYPLNDDFLKIFPETVPNDAQSFYKNIEEFLICHSDKQDGIETKPTIIKVTKKNGETHEQYGYYRDATKAKRLEDRLPRNHSFFEIDNMLLRTLTTSRAIDYVLSKLEKNFVESDEEKTIKKARDDLVIYIKGLFQESIALSENENLSESEKCIQLKISEKTFNTYLFQILHDHGLDDGITDSKGAKKLLMHYRYLSSLLDPARVMQTVIKDSNDVIHIETAIPITEKTDKQKNVLEKMKSVNRCSSERNYQHDQNMAIQTANSYFADLALKDNRRFSAQMRNWIPPTIKNGYIVCNEIEFDKSKKSYIHWSMRCGTIAYVGKGENKESKDESAKENIEQLKIYSKEFAGTEQIHFTLLNTDTLKKQHDIVNITYKATKSKNQKISYVPLNWDGTHRFTQNDPYVTQCAKAFDINYTVSSEPTSSDKKTRLSQATITIVIAGIKLNYTGNDNEFIKKLENVININTCASGQDRTGTAHEAAMILWSAIIYALEQNKKINTIKLAFTSESLKEYISQIETLRATGNSTDVIASLACPGSPGLKKDSKAANYFKKETEKQLYGGKSSKTNKSCQVDPSKIKRILKKLGHLPKMHYEKEKKSLQAGINKDPGSSLNSSAQKIIDEAECIKNPKNYGLLTDALKRTREAIEAPTDNDKQTRLKQLSQHCKKMKWSRKLGIGLGVVAGILLITAGVLFAIHTGGTSLLCSLMGVKILSLSLGYSIGAGAGTGAAGSGIAAGGYPLFRPKKYQLGKLLKETRKRIIPAR